MEQSTIENPQPKIASPYVGPRSFERGEMLYGRDREIQAISRLLIAERIVLLYSPSGAGKTSLIQAALIPRMEQRSFDVQPTIRVSTAGLPDLGTSFANRYRMSTLLSLEESVPPDQQLPLETLAQTSLADYIEQRLSASACDELVLIFDQFEEILTLNPTDQKAKHEFFTQLGNALRQMDNYWVLFSIREDYVASLTPYVHTVPTRFKNTFRLDLLAPRAAQQAMQQPARTAGIDFTDAAAEQLCKDLRLMQVQQPDGTLATQPGPHIEPVQLQVVCLRLWHNLPAGATAIDTDDITRIGNVNTALAAYYAEQVATSAQATGIAERTIRAWVDEYLITDQGIRGQVLKGAGESAGLHNDAIQQLIDAHLLRAEQRRGATWFELAHDRLIEPVQCDNAAWREANLSLLQRQAALWEQQRRPEGLLLRGAELDEAEAWVANYTGMLTDIEQQFLDACREVRERELQEQRNQFIIKAIAIVAVAFAVVAVILALVAFNAYNTAESERDRANRQLKISLSRQLASQSVRWKEQELDLALLLAVQADNIISTMESRSTLLNELRVSPHLDTTLRGHTSWVRNVALSPNGQTLASASCGERNKNRNCTQGEIILWDMSTGEPRGKPLHGHADDVLSVTFSPDGQTLASSSRDSTIWLWNVTTGQPRSNLLHGHTDAVWSVAFSPDGRTLASGSWDNTIRLWNVETGQPISNTLHMHTEAVRSVAFSPDGQILASGSDDNTIILWDVATGQPRGDPLRGHTLGVRSVAFSPDGKTLASGSEDSTIRLWDVATGQLRTNPLNGHTGSVLRVVFSPDGQRLASSGADTTLRLWNITTEQPSDPLRGHTASVHSVVFSPDGKTLVSGSGDTTIRLWNVATGQTDPLRKHTSTVTSVAFSPDGQTLASGSLDNTILLWDVASGQPLTDPLHGHSDAVWSVAFSPDGTTLASGSGDDTIWLWNVASGRPLYKPLDGHTDNVNSVMFSPDGQTLASGSSDQTVRLWDVATGKPHTEPLQGHELPVVTLTFSPDGQTLASGSEDTSIILWDIATRKPRGAPLRGHTSAVRSIAFSPDGKILASGSGDNTIRLWDVATRKPITDLIREHTSDVNTVTFSPDGKILASGSGDDTIRLWDVATRKLYVDPLRGHMSAVWSMAFSPDGNTLASGSLDSTIRIWDVSVESWKHRACRMVNRNLTLNEWQRYMGEVPYKRMCPELPGP